jgi:L-ascorbate metabolism protein UlaG (beta-lactamase superfamily)
LLLGLLLAGPVSGSELVVERLTWAGIKLVSGDTTVFMDAVGTDIWEGRAPGGLVPVVSDTARTYAVVSHSHNDHFDLDALRKALGPRGYVICHETIATLIASRGLRVIPAKMYEPVFRGAFMFTAVPAEDGFGDHQVSWVVSNGDQTVLHAGDTLWHGLWDNIGRQFGPFDAVFLPINGARIPSMTNQETPAVLTPQQALDASILLRAKLLIPIHFGSTGSADYIEVERPLETLLEHAKRRNQPVRNLVPGQIISIGEASH